MKLLYLLHMEKGIEKVVGLKDGYSFKAYHYGPFSSQLYSDIEFLQNVGLVRVTTKGIAGAADQGEENQIIEDVSAEENEESNYIYEESSYQLTEAGLKFVKDQLLPGLSTVAMEEFKEIKQKFAGIPLSSLLRYVYTKFPDSAKNTKLQYLVS